MRIALLFTILVSPFFFLPTLGAGIEQPTEVQVIEFDHTANDTLTIPNGDS